MSLHRFTQNHQQLVIEKESFYRNGVSLPNIQKCFCSVCIEAYVDLKTQRSNSGANDDRFYDPISKEGSNNYKNAVEKFKAHEKSESAFHRLCWRKQLMYQV